MGAVKDWARQHVLGWATSAALTLALLRFVTPSFIDMLIDGMSVALVWVAAKLGNQRA